MRFRWSRAARRPTDRVLAAPGVLRCNRRESAEARRRMRNALVMAIIGILVPIIIVKPHVGIYAWAWLSYMNPHRLAYGNVFAASFALIIALVTIFAYVVSREPKRYPLNTVTVTLFLWHIWISITTVFAINSALAVDYWIAVSKMLLMTYLTVPLINSRQRLETLAWVIASIRRILRNQGWPLGCGHGRGVRPHRPAKVND
jgi:hypothetical protein